MKTSLIYLLLFLTTGCNILNESKGDATPMMLDELREQILAVANSQNCTNAIEWTFTPMGSKACGGPATYIAYSKKIDEQRFLELVDQYTVMQAEYNRRNNVASDCALTPRPSGVICENNKPVLTY